MSLAPQCRSTRSGLTHISVAIDEVLDFLQAAAEASAEQHGALAGPVLPAQRRGSLGIDLIDDYRQEVETELEGWQP